MKVDYGELVQFPGGAVQYSRLVDDEILIVSTRSGEIKIPLKVINKALEDSWRFERTSRGK